MREFNVVEPIGSLYEDFLKKKREVCAKACEGSTSSLEVEPPQAHQFLVNVVCYCLNFNHYHFILEQLVDNGIIKFMQHLGTGYTMYFNKRYNRSGPLFQGKFKAKHIDSAKYLIWCSAYVNGADGF